MRLIVGLDEIDDGDVRRVGGKAVSLAVLHRAGRRVPRTLCLTTEAYDHFIDGASLRAVIRQELGRKRFEDMRWEELWDLSLRIRNHFLRAPVPESIAATVARRVDHELGLAPLAVRSSAPGEDSGESSFAGLHDSVVGVQGRNAALEAIRAVWASLWTDRALLYRRDLGIDVETSAMAVVIQELVEGSSSGVAFGVHPSDSQCAVIEAVFGLNQGLVDGTIEPDRWVIERTSGAVLEHSPPAERRRLVRRGADTVIDRVGGGPDTPPPLDAAGVARVFDALREAEAVFGTPQDVEWTLDEGRVVVLQARPVTTSAAGDGDRRAWYLSLTRSFETLRDLRSRVEEELLPAMDRDADELAAHDLGSLDSEELVAEIERRRATHDRWVDVYWSEFIPLAHGIRVFGQFYNEVVRPNDPYEFMELLAATPMMSVRRNRELAKLASGVRADPDLRSRLEAGETGNQAFERELQSFEREFGGATFGGQHCFGDRRRLVRLILALARTSAAPELTSATDAERLAGALLAAVPESRRRLARELLDLGRASYRLRDDDNMHLARLEGLVLDAVEEGRRRVRDHPDSHLSAPELDGVKRAIRSANLVVEPKPYATPPAVEPGFVSRPRQLVGQPAGPGVATGPARLIESVDDLFRVQPGDVLVCDTVDPNMTFVVPIAAGVVERRGGMLVHGAIIAREYGLPCVTGVPGATTLIAEGDRLTVDGYLGLVIRS